MKWGSERYAVQGLTLFLAFNAASFWGAVCAFLLKHDWFNAAWFLIPSVALGLIAAHRLHPRYSPKVA